MTTHAKVVTVIYIPVKRPIESEPDKVRVKVKTKAPGKT